MLCDNLVIFLLFLCDWDWIIKCKMNFHDVSHIWSLQTESWRHHDPSPIFPYQKFYQLEAQVTSHGGLCVDWGHDTQCNIGQGYPWYDVSQSLFIITVCWNVCPPHYWLLVLLVCLTICDWLVCSEWSQCTPVLTVQLYTPADHTLTSLYTSHICVYEIRLLYNFTPMPLYQTHSEVQLIVYFILYIYVCRSSIGFPL